MADTPFKTEPLELERGGSQLKLVVVSGPAFGKELVLTPGQHLVGSDPACALHIPDGSVSKRHLRVEVGARVELCDEGSTNGSFANGLRFSTLEGKAGTVIRLGRTELKLLPAAHRGPTLPPSSQDRFGALFGKSLPMRQLFAILERLAPTESNVLILGETGTGKEECARALHDHSARADGPFVVCDLAGVAPSLFESELFGHVKGAFTGAAQDRPGAFERAEGGTVFLDEVGELPLELQPRLLRALERREVKRVGGNNFRGVDVRVLSATHRDLKQEVAQGRFREDLYHRLAVTQVTLPALRDRLDDVPLLVDELLRRLGKGAESVGEDVREMLRTYRWPGNVRELRNVVERVISLGAMGLPEEEPRPAASPAGAGASELPYKEAKARLLEAFERDYLKGLLERCDHNLSLAAREAGIDRVFLRKLARKHGLVSGPD